ncbi:glyoxylase-like metal-dependent hydrolase (beta-lactamase superfamily II) [Geothermobacter ehrlichii]|uniref:Glyoxylase-like metal-dependent hydrolase (Beta-lactamase superfamily II) n=1 Tax=Geothermobacter ehrlichii TaxID=213224 RepID=A0A5D3WFV3_9BACT|nr:MBL fold metallo-hydrolase [Geothermobacter ehrlichii]TYO95826.1 glyoxylase-like metal-dependent hydrolase (beta-lactamase superfamily II) [Geothermobacter ehrlichii]
MSTIIQHTFDTPYPVGEVHCYSIELNGELVLFDTGPPTEVAKELLRQRLDLKRLRHVVCTHCHIDHYGLAAWLEREYGAIVHVPYRDALKMARHQERLAGIAELLYAHGFSRDFIENYRLIMKDGSVFPEFPADARVIEESDLPARLGFEVVPCPGHSQSDLVYVGDGWAVTGDVLLEGIFQSPLFDIDLETGERFNNYRAYCASLERMGTLRGRRICPGHRRTVESVEGVILFYVGKLLERTERIREHLLGDGNLASIVLGLFAEQAQHPFHLYLKASEVAFMQDFLREPRRLQQALRKIGLFEPLAEAFARVI